MAGQQVVEAGALFRRGYMWKGGEAASGIEYLEGLAPSANRGNEGEEGPVVCGGVEEAGVLKIDVREVVVEVVEGVAEESPCVLWS